MAKSENYVVTEKTTEGNESVDTRTVIDKDGFVVPYTTFIKNRRGWLGQED